MANEKKMTRSEIASKAGKARVKSMSRERLCEMAGRAGSSLYKGSLGGKTKMGPEPEIDARINDVTALKEIINLRKRGYTFAQIAATIGISRRNAMRLFYMARDKGLWED